MVVLGGCSGLVGGGSDRGTVTPAPVPTAGETYPPGVSEGSVEPAVLGKAHSRFLARTSYTVVSRQRISGADGTLRWTNRTRRVAAGGDAYAGWFNRTVVDFPAGTLPVTLEYWTNGSVHATRRFVGDEPTFYGWANAPSPIEGVDGSRVLVSTLRAVRVGVVDRPSGVVLVGSALRRPGLLPTPPYVTDLRNVSLTARVREDGVVTRWRIAYDATVKNRTVRVVRRTVVTDVGNTTVRRPDWIDTARKWEQVHDRE